MRVVGRRAEPTYEGLKPVLRICSDVETVCAEPTYEGLKQSWGQGVSCPSCSAEPTYEGLKPFRANFVLNALWVRSLPTRD